MFSNSETDTRLRRKGALGLAAILTLLFAWWLGALQHRALLDELALKGRQQLDLYVSYLNGQLGRYAFLPALLADDDRLASLLADPDDAELQHQVNRFLGQVNAIAGSLDVYLMDRHGITRAASNWRDERTFLGRNFGFRPYFIDAMRGHPGRYYALGTTSGRRGYYFSYPVGEPAAPAGVVVVKIDIDTLEHNWRSGGTELVISDPDGVIFVSTRSEWRFRSLSPLDAATIARIRESRRYEDAALTPVFGGIEQESAGRVFLRPAQPGGGGYMGLSTDMPLAGWRVGLLMSQDAIALQVWQTRLVALSILVLLVTVISLYLAGIRRRKERDAERRQAMQEALLELEGRVERRTADLTRANRLLRQEIEEHEQTRDELIQAAKLAALGQMSAGLNHELNQPLTAMRTYAENARTYLVRENLEQVGWNLQQISELTGRMAQISGQLKVFSRKASGRLTRVSLRACIDGMRRIVQARIAQSGAELRVSLPGHELFVAADSVQLEQVLVNLVGNACDAVLDRADRQIEVSAVEEGTRVRVHVRDNGPGIERENLDRIFDPFFTTHEGGLGLGLSISHTIVQRLGGSLTAANAGDGGALFTVTLRAWQES